MDLNSNIEDNVSHIEVASINFDQWILTVAIRVYSTDQSVLGMVHVIFRGVRGFRYLDEGDMLQYPFPEEATKKYVHPVQKSGWSNQESGFGNIVTSGHQEYLIATINECLCVLSYDEPIVVKEL